MADYKQILFFADEVSIEKRPAIEVAQDVKDLRESTQKELGLERNDPKIGVRSFYLNHSTSKGTQAVIDLATGIVATDCKYTMDNAYPTGKPLQAFQTKVHGDNAHFEWHEPKNKVYLPFSTFELVIGYDIGKKFKDTYALLVENRSPDQPTEISIPSGGMENQYSKNLRAIQNIPLTTNAFRQAIRYDAATALGLSESAFIGYRDLGITVMPGGVVAGGLLVANIDYKWLNRQYQGMQNAAKRNPDKAWKTPLIVPTWELSDFLKQTKVDPILSDDSLGDVIHTKGFLEPIYREALERRI
jgi:hypothetical protein